MNKIQSCLSLLGFPFQQQKGCTTDYVMNYLVTSLRYSAKKGRLRLSVFQQRHHSPILDDCTNKRFLKLISMILVMIDEKDDSSKLLTRGKMKMSQLKILLKGD